MELGTGILFSAIFLGTIALFIATKDRWNWKKIILWPLGIVVGVAVIGGSIGYFYQQHESRPRKLNELWEISLNDSLVDVKFKKGEPTTQLDNDFWIYQPSQTSDVSYVVYFKNNRVTSVMYFGPMYSAPYIHGVGHYDSLQELETKLGQPSFVSRSKDELRRAYSFEKFNIVVQFKAGTVSAIGIYDPATGPFRFKEESNATTKSN